MSRTSVPTIAFSAVIASTAGVAIGETAATTAPAAMGFSAERLDRVDDALQGCADRKDVAGLWASRSATSASGSQPDRPDIGHTNSHRYSGLVDAVSGLPRQQIGLDLCEVLARGRIPPLGDA